MINKRGESSVACKKNPRERPRNTTSSWMTRKDKEQKEGQPRRKQRKRGEREKVKKRRRREKTHTQEVGEGRKG